MQAADYSVSLGMDISEKCYAGLLVVKPESNHAQVMLDLLYTPVRFLRIKGLFSLADGESGFGVIFIRRDLHIGLNVMMNPSLGWSPVTVAEYWSGKNSRS